MRIILQTSDMLENPTGDSSIQFAQLSLGPI